MGRPGGSAALNLCVAPLLACSPPTASADPLENDVGRLHHFLNPHLDINIDLAAERTHIDRDIASY